MSKLLKKGQDNNLLEGNVSKTLFYLALPIIIINLLRTAYNIADAFWLGHLSKEALAAISFGFPVIFLLISLGMGIAIAGSVIVAQSEGSKLHGQRNFAASQTITFSLIAALTIGLVGFLVSEFMLGLLGASSNVLPLANSYLKIFFLGLFFPFGFSVFIALMRGYGDTLTPMYVMFGSVVLNIILDPFLIFGWSIFPRLGVEGAAIATVFSRGLALVVGLYILFSGKKGIKISLNEMLPNFKFLKKLLRIGIPASVEGTGRALAVNLLLAVVGTFSTTVVAGYGIGVRIFSMVFLPAMGVARGVSTITGQNVGAKKYSRAQEANYLAAKYTFLILSLLGVILFVFARQAAAIFTTNKAVINAASQFLRISALSFGFIGIARAFTGGFRGAGRTGIAAVIAIITLGVVRFPLALFGSRLWGATGIWIAFPVSNISGALIAWLWFRRGSWRQRLVEEDKERGEVAEDVDEIGETMTE